MRYRPHCLLILLFSPLALADILWMQNGDRLTGTIESITDRQVRIALPYTTPVTVSRTAVKRWRLESQDKPKPTGKGGISFPLLADDSANAWLLTGSSDLNIKLKENNKKTNNVNFKGTTEFANLDWRYSLEGEYSYETANNVTNNHQYQLKPMLDFFFNDHWFVRSAIDLDYDMLAADYLNLSYASGPGYRFWNDKHRRLELITQLGLQRAYFTAGYWGNTGMFDQRIINYPLVSQGWDYRQPISLWQEKIELFSKGAYEIYLKQPSPYLTRRQSVKGSVGVRYYFNDHLRLSWSTELEWDDSWLDYQGYHYSLDKKELRHLISLGASF